jgi:hypothetical protein
MGSRVSGEKQVPDSYEHGNELQGLTRGTEVIDYGSDYSLFKKCADPRS